jgi:hypothetical protein
MLEQCSAGIFAYTYTLAVAIKSIRLLAASKQSLLQESPPSRDEAQYWVKHSSPKAHHGMPCLAIRPSSPARKGETRRDTVAVMVRVDNAPKAVFFKLQSPFFLMAVVKLYCRIIKKRVPYINPINFRISPGARGVNPSIGVREAIAPAL